MTSGHSHSLTEVSFSLPSFAELFATMSLQAGYNSAVVVIGTTLLGIAAGTIGTFAVLRNRALMGDALAHSALPGLAMAFILGSLYGTTGRSLWLLLFGATISGLLGVVSVQLITKYSRLKEDTAIGAVLSCFFGLGIVLLSVIQSLRTGEAGGLEQFIFGQTAAMNRQDAFLMLGAASMSVITSVLFLKEFRLVSFDREFASADGWSVSAIDLLMMALVVFVTVVGLQAVGLLLIIALLIVPAAAARFWTDRLNAMLIGSALIGGLSGYIGACASSLLPRLPAGAVIVLVAGFIFLLSFLFAPARGLLSVLLKQFQMSLRVTEDHLLREMYERLEVMEAKRKTGLFLSIGEIPLTRTWNPFFRRLFLFYLGARYLVEIKGKGIAFLERGLSEAEQRARNHRLWEEYLLKYADMPISHVDYSADLVEHVLSPEIVTALEESLAERLAELGMQTPESVHPVAESN